MKTIYSKLIAIATAGLLANSVFAAEEKAVSLDELLKRLEQGLTEQSQQNAERERAFKSNLAEQDKMLRDATAERDRQNAISDQRIAESKENKLQIEQLQKQLNDELGTLKEIFGFLQQTAGTARGKFTSSLISSELPGRTEFLENFAKKMGQSSELASVEEIEKLIFEIQRETIKSGEVTSFTTTVAAGEARSEKTVTRVGSFALVSEGRYLDFDPEIQTTVELGSQPSGRFTSTIDDLETGTGNLVGFAMDPTGGSILRLLIQAPTNADRIEQGGIPGYIIIAIGVVAFIVSIWRTAVLLVTESKVRKQLKNEKLSDKNPLGRVLLVQKKYKNVAFDVLELKLGEAILKEIPAITRSVTFVKIVSVVAPLLGLLGTVTGMIITFQQITLFGTGDPSLMANGISQALVTTVLGLVVAIPTVLLYTWLNSRVKKIVHILQEQSAGIIAERAEQGA